MKSSRPGCPRDHQLEVRAPVFYNLFSNDDLSLFSGRVLDVNGTLCVLYRWIRDKYICLIVSSCHLGKVLLKNIYTRSDRTKFGILDQFCHLSICTQNKLCWNWKDTNHTPESEIKNNVYARWQSVSWLSLHSRTAKKCGFNIWMWNVHSYTFTLWNLQPGVRISFEDNIVIQLLYQFQNIIKILLSSTFWRYHTISDYHEILVYFR